MTGLVFGPKAKPWIETSAYLTDVLDDALEQTERAKHAEVMQQEEYQRPAMGVGALGNECRRAIAYIYFRTPVDPERETPGRMFRIFRRGHDAEAVMAEYLRTAGFELLTERAKGGQFRFDAAKYEDNGKGRLKGLADGVIVGFKSKYGSENARMYLAALPWPMLWENKEVKHKKWAKFEKIGVKSAAPEYYTQTQMLMAYLELENCLFTAKSADTQEVHSEVIAFDQKAAQAATDLAVKVIGSNSPEEHPRIGPDETFYKCRMCDFAKRCWSQKAAPGAVQNGQPVTAAPSWLTQK